jgi:hypothetical protein
MFAVATPYVMAESGTQGWHNGAGGPPWANGSNHYKHMTITTEGFVGSIQITEDSIREDIKDSVTVTLRDALDSAESSDFDVDSIKRASIGKVENENGEKFIAWILASINKSEETVAVNIFIVDAGDANNTTQVTKEFDPSMKNKAAFYQDSEGKSKRFEKLEQKLSESTGNTEIDALRAQFLEKIYEVKEAHQNGNSEKVDELRQELKDLRSQIVEIRKTQ